MIWQEKRKKRKEKKRKEKKRKEKKREKKKKEKKKDRIEGKKNPYIPGRLSTIHLCAYSVLICLQLTKANLMGLLS